MSDEIHANTIKVLEELCQSADMTYDDFYRSRQLDTLKRFIATGYKLQELPYGSALVNDKIHGWSIIKEERGNLREPACETALEALTKNDPANKSEIKKNWEI